MLFLEPMLISHCQDHGSVAGARVCVQWTAEKKKLKCKLYKWNWEDAAQGKTQTNHFIEDSTGEYTKLSTKSMRTVRFSFTELR